ncbi:hypothetical protein GUJ93_ZPchr0191g16376 [Zizania palustris]|uniref:Serine-threonine/tyrosine-protein kinase catalytic domain-containing protein n=1 Tax=Zizania palustris TaxID=103762 RepID=A0A8J5SUA5_ZIZPA|nr:hypothetical protein GUJ93_ZPchr0191g16376 [Zizania palustris]
MRWASVTANQRVRRRHGRSPSRVYTSSVPSRTGVHGTLFPRQVLRQERRREAAQLGRGWLLDAGGDRHLRKSLEEVAAVWQNLDHPNITKFIGVSMGTSNLMIPPSDDDARNNGDVPPPDRACCVVVEFLTGEP